MLFSADETRDFGSDIAAAVSDDYTPEESKFTGTVKWVRSISASPPRISIT